MSNVDIRFTSRAVEAIRELAPETVARKSILHELEEGLSQLHDPEDAERPAFRIEGTDPQYFAMQSGDRVAVFRPLSRVERERFDTQADQAFIVVDLLTPESLIVPEGESN
ncbi:hypothetical protein [Streptomyces sp. NPDC057438]|uniref:hypothetical protein n=1 Tax=Streptomyces sp. NPDC057438 TaxID=3346133 RepID=UPI0036B1596A